MKSLVPSALLALLVAGCASGPSSAPLPPDVNLVVPSASLAPDIRALAGKWSGKWKSRYGQLDHVLIVERLEGSSASVIYSTGALVSTQGGGPSPGWFRVNGTVEPGTLTLSMRNGAQVTYKLQADGTLSGTYVRQGDTSTGTLTRENS